MLRKNFPQRKAQRKVEAEARNAAFERMPLADRLNRNSKRYAKRTEGEVVPMSKRVR